MKIADRLEGVREEMTGLAAPMSLETNTPDVFKDVWRGAR
jgi:hypothetical protein